MNNSHDQNHPVQLQNYPSTSWIEGMALDELNMEESGIVHFESHLNPAYYLEESSLRFMDTLKERFEFYITRFNQYRCNSSTIGEIKNFKIANTVNDFMLFRNSLKLVVGRKASDLISIGFLSNSGGLFSARLNHETPAVNSTHDIKAHLGPFNDITWRFAGEVVNIDSLVKHYLTEFIRHSAR